MLSMNIKVLYFSKGGSTKMVADSMAQALSLPAADSLPMAYPLENAKLVFLGAGLHSGKIDDKIKEYIKTLDARHAKEIKNVALFSTTANDDDAAIKSMKELLESKGIHVLDKSFCCEQKSLFKRDRPNAADLKDAQDFAKACIDLVK